MSVCSPVFLFLGRDFLEAKNCGKRLVKKICRKNYLNVLTDKFYEFNSNRVESFLAFIPLIYFLYVAAIGYLNWKE